VLSGIVSHWNRESTYQNWERYDGRRDLATTTLEAKNGLCYVSGSLRKLATVPGLIFSDPNWVLLSIHLNIAELREVVHVVRRAWFR
jgi:hypothetical protein